MGIPMRLIPRFMRPQAVLFEDTFSAGHVDTSKWQTTDTESKITVSAGALSFSGGKASPAWADPALVSKAPYVWDRAAGLTIEWQVTPGAADKDCKLGFTDGSLAGTGYEAHALQLNSAPAWVASYNADITTPHSYSAATSYWLRIVLLATGALYYVSSDNRATWKLVWADATVTTTPLYAFIQSYNAALTASGCKVFRGSVLSPVVNAVSQTVTPVTTGSDLITNGAFTSDVTGWTAYNSASLSSVAGGQSGNCAQVAENGTANPAMGQGFTTTVGKWYRVTGYIKKGTAAGDTQLVIGSSAGGSQLSAVAPAAPTTSWVQHIRPFRAVGTTSYTTFYNWTSTAGATQLLDEVVAQEFTLSTLLGANQTGTKEGIWDVQIGGLSAGHVAGMWINTDGLSDGTQNAVEVIIDRAAGTIRVSKYVSGTLSNNVASTSQAYTNNGVLRAVRVGNSVAIYYASDGVTFSQIGSTLTISDATIVSQNGFRSFSTDSAATMTITNRGGLGIA